MKTCLNCVNWDFDGCTLFGEAKGQKDTCDQHDPEEVYVWGVFYANTNISDIIYDLYKTQEEAIEHAERIATTSSWINNIYVRNVNTGEDAN